MKRRVLGKNFYRRATVFVAQDLLGMYLVRRVRGKEYAYKITEVEVYDGFSDKASHAAKGMTARNHVMYGGAGVWYVYLVYGMHEMLNIVTREEGYPAAILIRGVEGISGPGKLTKTLHITRALNKKSATKNSGLWIEKRESLLARRRIQRTPRVGVDYAGKKWAGKKWRFIFP